jgi:hypothetical protein
LIHPVRQYYTVERYKTCTSRMKIVESDTPCTSPRQLQMVLFLLYDTEKSYVNARMPEKS